MNFNTKGSPLNILRREVPRFIINKHLTIESARLSVSNNFLIVSAGHRTSDNVDKTTIYVFNKDRDCVATFSSFDSLQGKLEFYNSVVKYVTEHFDKIPPEVNLNESSTSDKEAPIYNGFISRIVKILK